MGREGAVSPPQAKACPPQNYFPGAGAADVTSVPDACGSDREGTVANGGTARYWNVKCCSC